YLQVAPQRQVLQAIVGHNDIDVRVLFLQFLQGLAALGMHGYRYLRGLCDQRGFVAKVCRIKLALSDSGVAAHRGAIAPADDARLPAARLQGLNQCDDHRRLARAPHINIAHDDDRQPALVAKGRVAPVASFFVFYAQLQQPGQRQKQRAEPAFFLPGRMQGLGERRGFQGELWVAKFTRAIPARRAASMTRTTDSCVAWASALMTSTASTRPWMAARRAWVRSCSVVPVSNWPSRA